MLHVFCDTSSRLRDNFFFQITVGFFFSQYSPNVPLLVYPHIFLQLCVFL